ncbi:kin of IRRE-like protein 3 isoform X2 [Ptychodera flava]|uniref:kin of IRRE-like protein 3 isoform X2 n=1 Tax=Ptychodera flava TaxID=63121 RepID=UPI00396A00D5
MMVRPSLRILPQIFADFLNMCSRGAMVVSFLVFTSCFAFTLGVQQSFRVQPEEITTKISEATEVILKCAINNRAGQVQWTKDGSPFGSTRDIPGYPRHTMIGSDENGEFNLKISPVLLEDDGMYQCQVGPAPNHTYLISNEARLIVQRRPEAPVIKGAPEIAVTASVVSNLTCTSENGNPAPTLTWKKNGEVVTGAHHRSYPAGDETGKLSSTESALAITPSIDDMDAEYTCESKNLAGEEPISTKIKLNVRYIPIVGIVMDPLVAKEGDIISFKCKAAGNPQHGITYEWLKDDVVMPDKTENVMELADVPPEFNGITIKCKAKNSVGTGESSIAVTVEYGPRITTPPDDTEVDLGNTAKFQCEAVGNPTPKISWKRLGSNVLLSSMSTLQIDNVHNSDSGGYVCTASVRDFADVTATATLHIKSTPEISSSPDQFARVGKTANVECFTNTRPRPDRMLWQWEGGELEEGTEGRYSASIVDVYGGKKSTLQIRDVKKTDFIEYNCTVWNSIGVESLIIKLKEEEPTPWVIIIGGSVLGGAVLIFIIAIIIVLCNRCQARRRKRKLYEKERVEISPSEQKVEHHEPFYPEDVPYGTLNKPRYTAAPDNIYGSQRSHPRSRMSFESQYSSPSIDVYGEPQPVDYQGPVNYGAPYDRRPLDFEPRDFDDRDYGPLDNPDRDYPRDYDRDYPPSEPRGYVNPDPRTGDADYRPPSRASAGSHRDEFYGPQPPLGTLATNV